VPGTRGLVGGAGVRKRAAATARKESAHERLTIDALSKSFAACASPWRQSQHRTGERRLIIVPTAPAKTTLFNLITGEITPTAAR